MMFLARRVTGMNLYGRRRDYRWISRIINDGRHIRSRRLSMLSEEPNYSYTQADMLSFVKSTIHEREGANHCWLNSMSMDMVLKGSFDEDQVFLVLVNAFDNDSGRHLSHHDCVTVLERVKLLRCRYRKLNIFGLQHSSSLNSDVIRCNITKTFMEEYVSCPVLLTDLKFKEMESGACYLLFKGCGKQRVRLKLDAELEHIVENIGKLKIVHEKNNPTRPNSVGDEARHVIEEPYISSDFRNLLLYCPGGISVDEDGKRLFISDSNHHRIVISDVNGCILDCIGSSPGFEDGEFDSAKLFRPGGSFYAADEYCLYIADSENHAIRRADMNSRVLETVYPPNISKSRGIWSWILDKVGLARDVDSKTKEFDSDSITLPWHLLQLEEDNLLIVSRSYEMSWVLGMTTGEIKDVVKGFANIMNVYGHVLMERSSSFKNTFEDLFSDRRYHSLSLEGFPFAGLVSSVASFGNYMLFCDTAGHRILKCNRQTRSISYVQFSNIGILGLPYWLICSLEKFFNSAHSCKLWNEHVKRFNLLPGRCDILVNIDIPKGTELAAPFEEGCIWRQARGAVAEVSMSEDIGSPKEKVGIAQEWFDELDNLAFSKPGVDPELQDQNILQDVSFQAKDRVHLRSAVNISPGTGEVVVSAVLYLKLKKTEDSHKEDNSLASRILDLQSDGSSKPNEDACIKLLLRKSDIHEIVFMKPIHLRLWLECSDHPASLTQKETILTESSLVVNLSID